VDNDVFHEGVGERTDVAGNAVIRPPAGMHIAREPLGISAEIGEYFLPLRCSPAPNQRLHHAAERLEPRDAMVDHL
jgi:hypothetical protein